MLENQQQLDNALIYVDKIESAVAEIYNMNKAGFDGNKILSKSFSDFISVLNTTRDKLTKPSLSVAMIGTTSAGKSTIVNALSGRDVAPMEKKETSAGILRLLHSDERAINVAKTKGSKWPSGLTSNIADNEIMPIIAKIYDKYKKFVKTAAAPDITVWGPLQWQTNKELLSLPENLSVEFIDLPGLKTLTDNKNLEVIQSALSKSLCVIAMDFNDVDDSRIQRLLEELKDVVKAMGGKTDSLLFLLNKVDDVKSTDVPVEIVINGGTHNGVKIKGLTKKIAEALSLSSASNIKILPFVGILLYHAAQSIIKDHKGNIVSYDEQKLQQLFKDCANVFEGNEHLLSDEEIDAKDRIKYSLRKKLNISLEDLKIFENICYNLSHAKDFYEDLRMRINDSFYDIIIRPILYDLEINLDKLIADLTSYININKKTSKLELYSERIGILKMKLFLLGTNSEKNHNEIMSELSAISMELDSLDVSNDEDTLFVYNRIKRDVAKMISSIEGHPCGYIDSQIEDINASISDITSNLLGLQGAENVNKYLNDIKDTNRAVNVFNGISGIPENIKKRLKTEVLIPFRQALDEKKKKEDFIELASKTMPVLFAEDLSGQYSNLYNLFYDTFSSFTLRDKDYWKKTSTEYSTSWEESVKEVYHWVDVRMRDILSRKTNIYFQLDTTTFITILNNYLHSELASILKELKKRLHVNETDFSVLIDNLMNVKKMEIIIPDTLFQFATPKATNGNIGYDSRREIDYYKHHSCSSDEAVYKTVYDKYYEYKYENSKSVYKRWEGGIDKSFAPFWTIITGWIKDSVQSYMENIRESALQVADMTTSFLDEKMNNINSTNAENLAVFLSLEDKMQALLQLTNKSM